jgi:Flp pilus assembly protein TadG
MSQGNRGTAALEYAILLPALLMILVGALDTGRVMWLQVTLERAVDAAARCAAINANTCNSVANIQNYAATQAFGTTINASAFAVTTAVCGTSITGTLPFAFIIPWPGKRTITLSATACYPPKTGTAS